MAETVVTSYGLPEEWEAQELLELVMADAPEGWFAFGLSAEVIKEQPQKPKRKRGKPGKYETFQAIMQDARQGKKTAWESGMQYRKLYPLQEGERLATPVDRFAPISFMVILALAADLKAKLPEARAVWCAWLISGRFVAIDRNETVETEEDRARSLFRSMLERDPNWIPDYQKLSADFPLIAPARDDAGEKIKDRAKRLKALVAQVRRKMGLKAPKPPSIKEKVEALAQDGLSVDLIAIRLRKEGLTPSRSYLEKVYRDVIPRAKPVVRDIGPISPQAMRWLNLSPADKGKPVPMDPDLELKPSASLTEEARFLLQKGLSYKQVSEKLQEERRMIVPEKSLRRIAAEIRKEKKAAPLSEAVSRSDIARALLQEGRSADQVNQELSRRGLEPLSKGRIRALKVSR